tara:strand:+ start:1387 stop:2808 length:1422 start_codon:yes stop_codon:yes gene_type:complete
MTEKAIVWIRDDFRLKNNQALSFALNNHSLISVIYIYNNERFDNVREAQKWWISRSLKNYKIDLKKYNIDLEIIFSEELNFFSKLKSKDNISVYWNKIYEPEQLKLDKNIIELFKKNKINTKCFKGNVLNEYDKVTKDDGSPYKVYSPFWRYGEQIYLDSVPVKKLNLKKQSKRIKFFKSSFNAEHILPKQKWFKKFEKYWIPSEKESDKFLDEFLKTGISKYAIDRDFPSIKGTSKLSPYIRNGQIHVSDIWEKCYKLKSKSISAKKYLNELGWREFSHSLINNFPQMLKGNLRKEFDKFPWDKNAKNLLAWKHGMTGYPIVDAGMRELYETGWMHNRIRMVVGSFLVKHLRINWKEGEKHFRNCLLDFNEANNVAQWQWVAGCGADAAPYFRIFNPILQGEKFDKDGFYVKKWVPELSKVPPKFIHKPWELENKYQLAINTVIGKDYPKPIVIHEKARESALAAFQSLKKN